MTKNTYEACIFDMDGTLVDSSWAVAVNDAEILCRFGLETSPQELFCDFGGADTRDKITGVAGRLGVEVSPGQMAEIHAARTEAHDRLYAETAMPAFDGVVDLLARLASDRCVASSNPVEKVRSTLDRAGLLSHFGEHVYGGDQVKHKKPAPDLFLYAAEKLGIAPENCLVIEDSCEGVTAAVRAGMTAIGFTGGYRQLGYQMSLRLMEAGASAHFSTYDMLGQYLSGMLPPSHGVPSARRTSAPVPAQS